MKAITVKVKEVELRHPARLGALTTTTSLYHLRWALLVGLGEMLQNSMYFTRIEATEHERKGWITCRTPMDTQCMTVYLENSLCFHGYLDVSE